MVRLSPFATDVIKTIQKIPQGKVATYAQIAELSGKPHAARGVSWILHSCSRRYRLPWQRVVNSKGQISFKEKSRNYRLQKILLQKEGVAFSENDQILMRKYQWSKKPKRKRRPKNTPKMFS